MQLPIVTLPKTTHNSFVELVLIHRILFCRNDSSHSSNQIDILSQLSNEIDKAQCEQILTNLEKYKINKYMSNFYHDSQCGTIELIFRDIILKHYTNEYQNEILMSPKNSINISMNNEFECQLFNQDDLVPQIFQYLDLTSLNNCSLVNLIWLCHSFNINSLYHLRISEWINLQLKHNDKNNNNSGEVKHVYVPLTELQLNHNDNNNNNNNNSDEVKLVYVPVTELQRLINVRRIEYNFEDFEYDYRYYCFDDRFLTYFSCLQNVEQLTWNSYLRVIKRDVSILKILLQNNTVKKLKHLHCYLDCITFSKTDAAHEGITSMKLLPVMRIMNVESIWLRSITIPFICGNQCRELLLDDVQFTNTLYKSMINECDLTGVEKLVIGNLSMTSDFFVDNDNCNYSNSQLILKENCNLNSNSNCNHKYNFELIGQKLVNVKQISVIGMQKDSLKFLQALKPIVDKNDCQISLFFPFFYDDGTETTTCVLKQQEFFDFALKNKWNVTEISLGLHSECQGQSVRILKKILDSDDTAGNLETLKLTVHTTERYGGLFECVSDTMMRRLNADLDCPDSNAINISDIEKMQERKSNVNSDTSINIDHNINTYSCDDQRSIYLPVIPDPRYTLKNYEFRSTSRFIKLQKIVCTCDTKVWEFHSERLISDLNGLSQFLTLNFNKNNIDICNHRDNVIFWQVKATFLWPSDAARVGYLHSYDINYTAKPNEREEAEMEYYKKIDMCLKELFSNINTFFVISQIPIDFILEIHHTELNSKDHPRCKQLKHGYEKYFLKAFASQLATDGCKAFKQNNNYNNTDNEYQMPFGNKYCVPMSQPQIESQYSTEKVHFDDCNSIKFVVKTAMEKNCSESGFRFHSLSEPFKYW